MRPAVAYILKGFPRVSETFIANEVRLLSQYGVQLGLFSIKRGDELAASQDLPAVTYAPSVGSLSRTHLLVWLARNIAPFVGAQVFLLGNSPRRYLATLWFAVGCAIRYRHWSASAVKKTFIKEFLFAGYFARDIIRDGRFSHLHAHFCHDATTVAWMVSQLTNLPFSFTAHAKDIYQQRLNPGDLLSRKISAGRFVVTCTRANVAALASHTDQPEKIHAIYHGLDIRLFYSGGNNPEVSRPRLLAIGRHVAKKGFSYLLQACALLRARGVDFELHLIGESGDETPQLHKLVNDLDLHGYVILKAPMRHEELAQEYRNAAAFVLPCVVMEDGDRDGIPNVIGEAMASSVPVIVTGVSGIPELVSHDVNGIIVPSKDPVALADAIGRVLGDAALSRQLGAEARRQVENIFDAADTHKTLKALFDQFLAGDPHVYS